MSDTAPDAPRLIANTKPIVRRGGDGQLRVYNGIAWCPEVEEVFLDALATTCNVRAAIRAAGVDSPTPYRQRRKRPDFAAKWDAVLAIGFARLELELMAAASAAVGGDIGIDPDETPDALARAAADRAGPRVAPMTPADAVRLLGMYHARQARTGGVRGHARRVKSFQEVRGEILSQIEAIVLAGPEAAEDAVAAMDAAADSGDAMP